MPAIYRMSAHPDRRVDNIGLVPVVRNDLMRQGADCRGRMFRGSVEKTAVVGRVIQQDTSIGIRESMLQLVSAPICWEGRALGDANRPAPIRQLGREGHQLSRKARGRWFDVQQAR